MAYIKINQDRIKNPESLIPLCPFNAIEIADGNLLINAGCRMCRMCIRKSEGVFVFVEEDKPLNANSSWRGISVIAEIIEGHVHPITFELLGKAGELAEKVGQPVFCALIGNNVSSLCDSILEYGADEVAVYDNAAFENFRIEPYTAAVEDFITRYRPAVVLVGGTQSGRTLAPRTAARLRTGLTADCTFLDITENSDLDQIRPAYGGNIMAHINTPHHRPQFATVRYKVFPIPEKNAKSGKITICEIDEEKLKSAIEILNITEKTREHGIEEAEVLIVAGRGIKKREDMSMLEELAKMLNGRIASTRSLVENQWTDAKQQIGLSGRTVKPKLIITCGVSGAIQFVAGMSGAEEIIAINTDPEAPIFKVAHVGIVGDIYTVIPKLTELIKGAHK